MKRTTRLSAGLRLKIIILSAERRLERGQDWLDIRRAGIVRLLADRRLRGVRITRGGLRAYLPSTGGAHSLLYAPGLVDPGDLWSALTPAAGVALPTLFRTCAPAAAAALLQAL